MNQTLPLMKTTRFFLLAIFLLAASVTVIYSCKKDKDNTPTVPVYTNGQGEVGSAGGTVMIDDANSPINGASIEIPEGALNSTVDIKIVTAPSNIYVSGDEQVVLVGFEPNGLTFEKPVEIKLPYNSGNANNQRAFFYNPETFEISQIPVTSATNGVVIATTNHFSYYFATSENFGLGIEMLNIGGKIGARVNYMSFNSNNGIYNIPAVSYDNAHNAIISSTDAVYSFFKVNLFEKNDFWFDSDKGIINIQVKKYRLNGIIKADILFGGSTIYLTDNLTLEEGGTCDLWFEGKPLIFYFENFTPTSSDSYYIRVKWRLTRHATNIDNVNDRYTDLYEVNNEDADKKLSEMGSFASGDLFEECIDEQYINGSGLKPGVITNEASLITCSSARLNGTLDNLGSGQITRHGFCLSETPSPTVNDEHVINLGAIDEQGSFNYDYSFTPPHLLPNTQYYYRAYAENSAGVAYGEDITFWTSDDSEAPTFIGHEPGVGETVSGNVNIIMSILEGCGIDKAEFYVKPNGGNYTLIGDDPEPSYISNDVYHATITWNTNEFANGSYTIKVLANDMAGLLNNKTWDVIVNNSGSNTPPTALFTVSPSSGTTSTNFAFDASGCTDNETPTNQLQVRWDFDGNGSWDTNWDTDKTQNHQYSSEASYQAKVEVKDTEGLTDTYTKSITVSNGGGGTGTFTDPRDGQTYTTVDIGSQTWFAENLNYETANSWWYNNSSANGDIYGRLYNWDAALNACPSGWHLPSDEEWKTLEMALGMSQNEADDTGWRGTDEGGKMKEAGTAHWNSPNTGATNSSGFTALPGGYRNSSGSFYYLGNYGYWWSSSEGSGTGAWGRYLGYGNVQVRRNLYDKTYGFSVRCLKN